jgi:hypothetical protein
MRIIWGCSPVYSRMYSSYKETIRYPHNEHT